MISFWGCPWAIPQPRISFSNESEHIPNTGTADPLALKLRANFGFRREYWRGYSDAANGPMQGSEARLDLVHNALLAQGVTPTDLQTAKNYMNARRAYILSQLQTVAAIFTAAGPATTTTNRVTLTGTAPVQVSTIAVNGRTLTPAWSTVSNWSAAFIVATGTNYLAISAYGSAGTVLATTNLTVAFVGTNAWPPLRINEWMADNAGFVRDPADNDKEDWFELYNPTASAANLAGWTLTDSLGDPARFVVPSGYLVPAGGFLLVWADGEPDQNSTNRPDLHVSFKLEKNGEAIGLFAPDGTLMDGVAFGVQAADTSEGRFPEGAATLRQLTLPTPGSANALTEVTSLTWAGGTVTLTFTTTPGLYLPGRVQRGPFCLDTAGPGPDRYRHDPDRPGPWRRPVAPLLSDHHHILGRLAAGIPRPRLTLPPGDGLQADSVCG